MAARWGWIRTLHKIAALFSYCGGPLFLFDVLKGLEYSVTAAFWITLPPIGIMAWGAAHLSDDPRSRWARALVRAGNVGAYVALGMHAYAIWSFVRGVRAPSQSLHYIGVVVGVAWSIAYVLAAIRWEASAPAPAREDARDSTDPIEPT